MNAIALRVTTLCLGSSLLMGSYLVKGIAPQARPPAVSTIVHLAQYNPPKSVQLDPTTDVIVAQQQIQIQDNLVTTQQNASDIRQLDEIMRQVDTRELEHFNLLSHQQDLDETKVIQTLKVMGWIVAILEFIHLLFTLRSQFKDAAIQRRLMYRLAKRRRKPTSRAEQRDDEDDTSNDAVADDIEEGQDANDNDC